MANLCCSIETEPRTLSQGQLNHAREIAADVIQKMEPKQASTIFSEGLRGVKRNGSEEEDDKVEIMVVESPCQCSVVNNSIESPDLSLKLKEPSTAPF